MPQMALSPTARPAAAAPMSRSIGPSRARASAAQNVLSQRSLCRNVTARLDYSSRGVQRRGMTMSAGTVYASAAGDDMEPIVGAGDKARVIVVTSGKGGVGKTTTTANLGMSIARLGYRVALIDADIGLRNLDLLLGLENRVMYTAMEVLEGECRLEQALIRDKRWRNLALLAISKNRQRYNITSRNMETLAELLVEKGFQYIFVDCPAGIDLGFLNAIAPAKEAVIVTTPEITSIRDADRVAGLLEANGIYDVKLVVNRVRADMIKGAIPEDTNVIVSTNRGEPLVLKKKLTLAGIAYENAARRLVGKKDFLIDLSSPYKNVFQRAKEFLTGGDDKE